jgi:PTH1 family peptidyl-tRNA hydrolase
MTYIIAGLGNPGEEYQDTRHNTGRNMLFSLAQSIGAGSMGSARSTDVFSLDKKIKALTAKGEIGPVAEKGKKSPKNSKKEKVLLVAPETFMNNSGKAIGPLVTKDNKANLKAAEKLIVIYDDFNLPLGSIRVSWNRSAGGHNGLASVIKAVKTEAFVRVRVGVAPAKSDGTAKTPHGDREIEKFILSKFKPAEVAELKKVTKRVIGAIETIVSDGREKAMSIYNAG